MASTSAAGPSSQPSRPPVVDDVEKLIFAYDAAHDHLGARCLKPKGSKTDDPRRVEIVIEVIDKMYQNQVSLVSPTT